MGFTRKVTTSLSLPTEPNKPPTELTDYCSMIYTRKQWGKSTLFSQYPRCLNIQFEPGRVGLKIFQVAPKNPQEAIGYIKLFIESPDFDMVFIDTVDRFYDMVLREACLSRSEGKLDHPGKFGKEGYALWDFAKNDFEEVFVSILDSGKKFLLSSHDKKVEQKDRDGLEWNRIEPTCKPAAWKIAQSMCDFVFHGDFLNGERIITIRDLDNTTLASCNPDIECFLDPSGEPLRRFVIPNDKTKAFQGLLDAFNNKVQDCSYVPPKKPLVVKKPLVMVKA